MVYSIYMSNEICCKCQKAPDDGFAAWDGKGNQSCWTCFGRYGWNAFPIAPTAEELHAARTSH